MSTSSPQSTSVLSEAQLTAAPTAVAASGPYAQPNLDASGRVGEARAFGTLRAAVGPFVPAPWRTGSVADQESTEWMTAEAAAAPTPPAAAVAAVPSIELPWIHGFLDHATPAASEPDAVESLYGAVAIDSLAEAPVESAVVENDADRVEDVPVEALFADAAQADADQNHLTAFEAPVFDAPVFDAAAETPMAEVPMAEAPLAEAPMAEAPMAEAPMAEAPLAEAPMAEATLIEEAPLAATERADDVDLEVETAPEAVAMIEASGEESADADAAGTWPLDDAGALMRALAAELPATAPVFALPRHEAGKPYATPLGVPPIATTPPLPMWGDDDMMDIMPVHRSEGNSAEWGQAGAGDELASSSLDASSSELAAAAAQLEALARRVRQGDLTLAGYTSDMSDAATLAATLTALLSTRS